jgi:hypothetical protein
MPSVLHFLSRPAIPLCSLLLAAATTHAQSPEYVSVNLVQPATVAATASSPAHTTAPDIALHWEQPPVVLLDNDCLPIPIAEVPVELVELSVRRPAYDSPGVVLHWTTNTELHNAGFVIERREEGQAEFRRIATVPGQGTSHDSHRYAFVDEPNRNPGTSYYRLRQLDAAGGPSTISSPQAVVGLPAGLPKPEPN